MPVFLLSKNHSINENFELNSNDLYHLTKVLRYRSGDEFMITMPNGQRATAILSSDNSQWTTQIKEILPLTSDLPLPLTIGIGLIRWPRLEWLVEKCCELGVAKVTLLQLQRCQNSKQSSNFSKKIERLNRISQETVKQCERSFGTEVVGPTNLENWLKDLPIPQQSKRILCHERIRQPILSEAFSSNNRHYTVIVGPEGGLSQEEISYLQENSFESVSLGKHPLRAETAALYSATCLDFYLKSQLPRS